MRIQQIKKTLIRDLGIALGVVLVLGGILFYILSIRNEMRETEAKTKREVQLAQNRITTLEAENKQFLEAFETYDKIPQNKLAYDLEETTLRSETLRPIITDLSRRYRLQNVQVVLKQGVKLGPAFTSRTVSSYSGSLEMKFDAMTDEMVLSFIDSFQQVMPGFINLQSLKMTKTAEITAATFQQVQNQQTPALVKVELVMNWVTLKEEARR